MADLDSSADDLLGLIDWKDFFDGFPDATNALELEPPIPPFSNSSPDSISSWINELENALMNDDQDNAFSVLLDSHGVIDVDSNASEKVSTAPSNDCCGSLMPEVLVDSHDGSSGVDAVVDVDSNASDFGDGLNKSQKEKVDEANIDDTGDEDADDPISKKRRRQLRNRDAAVRSRERKKTYVKDLEMKSKFLEAECRRLGRLLQCYCAENQALRFSLQMGGASGASLTKQESAVLLLESLLLGSLLWLVGTVCLFMLPQLLQSTLEPVPRVTMVVEGGRGSAGGNDESRYSYSLSLQTRGCRAARTRMKRGERYLSLVRL